MNLKNVYAAFAAMALTVALSAEAGKSVPYSSDLYPGGRQDSDWIVKNMVSRYGVSWLGEDNDSFTAAVGATGSAKKPYDYSQSKDADAWLISPTISLSAGKEYTVSVYARTKAGYGETENFKINAVEASAVDTSVDESALASTIVGALKSGTTVINKKNYSNTGGFEKIEATFTPAVSGDYYFGIQCYSEPDMDHLFVTKFAVEGEGGGGDDPILPPVDGKPMPYIYDFQDSDQFNNEWTKVTGPDAQETATKWAYNSFLHCAKWDFSEDLKEDNWLISPAIAVDHAGPYALDILTMVYGRLEVLLGTDKNDLTSFDVVETITDSPVWDDDEAPRRIMVNIEERGTYYVAFRACAESGTIMGYRVGYCGLKELVSTPGVATNMKASADSFDELAVAVSWVYPSVTNTGEPLESIVKAELYRGNDLLETYYSPRPGGSWAYMDETVPAPGIYTYSIKVYGVSGYDTDHAPASATTGYVGKPMVEFPVNETISTSSAILYTLNDANEDGAGWNYVEGWWSDKFSSVNDLGDEEAAMDDWLITPYVNLEPGVYRLTMKTGGDNNVYEIGYVTNRHIPASTFVNLLTVDNDTYSSTSDHDCFVKIAEAGDYAFAVHHIGGLIDPTRTYYNEVNFDGFKLIAQPRLPETVTELTAKGASDNSLKATISWTNPAIDIVGDPVTSITKVEIKRNYEIIATITEGLVPGQPYVYTDEMVPADGEYVYSVLAYSENGISESQAPSVNVYVGVGKKAPYVTSEFDDWKEESNQSWYGWEYSWNDIYEFSKSWGDPCEAYTYSPYFEIEEGREYEIGITVAAGNTIDADVLYGPQRDKGGLQTLGVLTQNTEDEEHIFTFKGASAAVQSDEATAPVVIAPGKQVFAMHVNGIGQIGIKAFRLDVKNGTTGVETVSAASGMLTYNGGMVTCSEASDMAVYALDGTLLLSAQGVSELDLAGLAKGTTLVVTAKVKGSLSTLKIRL